MHLCQGPKVLPRASVKRQLHVHNLYSLLTTDKCRTIRCESSGRAASARVASTHECCNQEVSLSLHNREVAEWGATQCCSKPGACGKEPEGTRMCALMAINQTQIRGNE